MTPAEAFGQYLELYRGRRTEVTSVSTVVRRLNEAAEKALPGVIGCYKAGNYEGLAECRPDRLLAPDYGVNIDALSMYADVAASFRCGVPQLQSNLAVVANDCIHLSEALSENKAEGMEVYKLSTLPEALAGEALDVLAACGRGVGASVTGLLNDLLLNDGMYVRITGRATRPLQIVNIFRSDVPVLTSRRLIVHALPGSFGQILLCDHSQSPVVEHLNLQGVDVLVERDANVEIYDIEESSAATRRIFNFSAVQREASKLTANTNFLSGGVTSNNWRLDTVEPHTETSLSGLAIASAGQVVENHVTLSHSSTHAYSRQLFKNALFDNARAGFGGRIIVKEGAVFTDASQNNRNILISPEAHMEASPQLEIYCDEVKCSHGATTGQLDDRALFYMQSRGIPLEQARRLLTQAFMADVVDHVACEVLRQRLHILVERRLDGKAESCGSCATACRTSNTAEL